MHRRLPSLRESSPRPDIGGRAPMKYTTYSRYLPELADTINLQGLLDQLADFLLQSGFAGGAYSHPFWGEFGEDDADRSLDALRQAILQALMESGQLTPEMLKLLRGESTGDAARDADLERQLSELLDKIVQKLIEEGYLNVSEAPKMPAGQQPLLGPGGMAKEAAQQVQFNLTEKGIEFLGYRTLKHLLGSIGKSSFGAHDTEHLATGIEAEAVSKPYEYGDTLNLDVNATLTNALQREGLGVPINLEYDDLMVHQAEYRSSSATVLMLDCSHSMILYGEDRSTRSVSHAIPGRHAARGAVPRHGRGDPARPARPRPGGAVPHEHRRGAQAVAPHASVAAQGHAPDHHDHGREAVRAHSSRRPDLRQLHGPRSPDPASHLPRGGVVPALRDHDQHVHARAGPESRGVREESLGDLPREGLLHEHDDAGAVHSDGLHATEDAAGFLADSIRLPRRATRLCLATGRPWCILKPSGALILYAPSVSSPMPRGSKSRVRY